METEKAPGMSLFLAQLSPEDGAENGRAIHFVRQWYLNFCIKSKNPTQEMTTAICRNYIYRTKFAEEQTLNLMKAENPQKE